MLYNLTLFISNLHTNINVINFSYFSGISKETSEKLTAQTPENNIKKVDRPLPKISPNLDKKRRRVIEKDRHGSLMKKFKNPSIAQSSKELIKRKKKSAEHKETIKNKLKELTESKKPAVDNDELSNVINDSAERSNRDSRKRTLSNSNNDGPLKEVNLMRASVNVKTKVTENNRGVFLTSAIPKTVPKRRASQAASGDASSLPKRVNRSTSNYGSFNMFEGLDTYAERTKNVLSKKFIKNKVNEENVSRKI